MTAAIALLALTLAAPLQIARSRQVLEIDSVEQADLLSFKELRLGKPQLGVGSPSAPIQLVITRKNASHADWKSWRKSVVAKKSEQKSLSLVTINGDQTEGARVNYFHCLPTDYSATPKVETVSISCETKKVPNEGPRKPSKLK